MTYKKLPGYAIFVCACVLLCVCVDKGVTLSAEQGHRTNGPWTFVQFAGVLFLISAQALNAARAALDSDADPSGGMIRGLDLPSISDTWVYVCPLGARGL